MSLPLVKKWLVASAELAKFGALEMRLRKEVFDEFQPGKHELKGGTLLVKATDNITIDDASVDAVMEEMEPGARTELVNWKPNLSMKAYNGLPEDQRRIFDQCLTIKPGAPKVEWKASE